MKSSGIGDAHAGTKTKSLGGGVAFRSVQTTHDETARTSGRAYLYFWPGGLTERASIQLHLSDDTTLSLLVSPVTGRVTVKAGSVDLEFPTDDKSASDRVDTGY